jgi:hypothetical protein
MMMMMAMKTPHHILPSQPRKGRWIISDDGSGSVLRLEEESSLSIEETTMNHPRTNSGWIYQLFEISYKRRLSFVCRSLAPIGKKACLTKASGDTICTRRG